MWAKIFTSLLLACAFLIAPVKQPQARQESLVALGDSITYGTSLDDRSKGYASLLADGLEMKLTNLAVEGLQSDALLDMLNSDQKVVSAVRSAKLVCMSIGGNELLVPLIGVLSDRMGEVDLADLGFQDILKLMSLLGDETVIEEIRVAAEARVLIFINTYPDVVERIYEINPDVTIITQTVFNPYESLMEDEGSSLYSLRSFFDDINDVILRTQGPIVVDAATVFLGRAEDLTFSASFDPHPNAAGHAVIATLMLDRLERLGW